MKSPHLIIVFIFLWLFFCLEGGFSVYAAPTISNITDNRSGYSGGQIPRYEKFEITFTAATAATNPQMPYDPNAPVGIKDAGGRLYDKYNGVNIYGVFTSPSGKTYSQPAFYYQNFDEQTVEGRAWYYPAGSYNWKIRFAPDEIGDWQYKISAQDASGTVLSASQGFTVSTSSNHGFVRVSPNDPRYFQFDDGTHFPNLGWNGPLDFDNPDNNKNYFSSLATHGIQTLRFWITAWNIFGSSWNSWYMIKGPYDGYLPRTGFITNGASSTPQVPSSVMTLVYSEDGGGQNSGSWFDACAFTGGFPPKIPVKNNTKYHIKVRYQAKGIAGPRNSAYPGYGLVAKLQNPNDGNWHRNCYNGGDPQNGVKVSGYVHDTAGWAADATGNLSSTSWSYLESDWTSGGVSGGRGFMPILYLALENVNNLTATVNGIAYNWHPYAYIDTIEIREDMGGGNYGPNIVPKPSAETLTYFMDRNALAFDKVIDQAHAAGIYLKTVVMEKNEQSENEIGADGKKAGFDNNNFYAGDPNNRRNITAVRWLQQAWWRYLQARWGYSTNIHSWEAVNEADPGNANHYIQTDEMGKYMHCSVFGVSIPGGDGQKCNNDNPNAHLVTTSFWLGFPATEFWRNSKYPNVDFADIHDYINKPSESLHYFDTALATYDLSMYYGAKQQNGAGKPVVRGETGLILDDGTDATSSEMDTQGVWLHNFIWGGINPGGLTEAWWHTGQISSGAKDLRGLYKHYYDFVNNIPLGNGKYQDAAAIVSDANVRAWGQKDSVGQMASHAHLWLQNKKHIWCALSSISGCPTTWDGSRLVGTVKVGGFSPNTVYPVEWWNFDNNVVLSKSATTTTSDASGVITLNLTTLPAGVTDSGIKIGDYTANTPTPTVTPAVCPMKSSGDADCNGKVELLDFEIFRKEYLRVVSAITSDFDADGSVTIADFQVWRGGYFK